MNEVKTEELDKGQRLRLNFMIFIRTKAHNLSGKVYRIYDILDKVETRVRDGGNSINSTHDEDQEYLKEITLISVKASNLLSKLEQATKDL